MRQEARPIAYRGAAGRPSAGTFGFSLRWFAGSWLTVILLGCATLPANEPAAEKPSAEELTVESVQNRLQEVESAQALDDPTKAKLRELFQQAIGDLEAAKASGASAERHAQMASSAPAELQETKSALASLPRQSMLSIPDASLVQLEQTLSQKSSELAADKAELAELEAEPKRRAARRVEIPKRIATVREQLGEIGSKLQALAAADDPSEIAAAKRIALAARRRALEQEIRSYQAELESYDARAELLPLRRDLAAGRVALGEQELTKWREAINRQRRRDAESQLRRAREEVQQAHPAIAGLMRENAELAERRKALAELIVQTTGRLEKANRDLAALEDQFKRTREKVDAVGQTNAIGLLLRKQRQAMPDVRSQYENIRRRQPVIQECQLELLQLDDRRNDLADIEEQIRKEIEAARREERVENEYEVEWAARRALETEKEYLDALMVDLNSYFDKLIDLDNAERELTRKTEEYIEYIDERVLWIRSTSPLGVASLEHLGRAAAWLSDADTWCDLVRGLAIDARQNPFRTAAALLAFVLLLGAQRPLRRRLNHVGERAEMANCCRLLPTVEAVGLTAGLSAPLPGVLWYLSWRLDANLAPTAFASAVAAGAGFAAAAYLVLDLFEKHCRHNGLADSHFGWPVSALRPIRHSVRIAKVLILPLMFVVATMDAQPNDRWSDSLGRACFIAAMFASAVVVLRSLRPKGPIYQALLMTHRGGRLYSFRMVLYSVAVLLPVTLAVLAAAGYYYTAHQLAHRMLACGGLLLGLMLVRSLLLRWVLVRRRKLAIQHARERRAAAQTEPSPTGGDAGTVSVIPTAGEPTLDLATINVQTQRFVEYTFALAGMLGMWLVWVDVLPALGALDHVVVWTTAAGAEAISLADLGLATLVVAMTFMAARNAPGLLEMTFLERLPLDAGFRYTIGTVSRYVIVLVGILVSCHMIGLTWGTVQWLVAAISVGLGFGLQEIFANFISGLIILFERPVRVGDVVTVADITGVISRIRMRATTITNWDRKEFIVPNKEFITGRLLNWTLSDQINRVVVHVGIAYGSDTTVAAELIHKVAREHPLVVDEPAPRVTFEEFGASSLNYVLRCFLPDMENRLQVIHELHTAIDREFRAAGVEIAFPQQDVHVRTVHADAELLGKLFTGNSGPPTVDEPTSRNRQTPHAA